MKKIKFVLMIAAIAIGFGAMAQFTYGPKVGLNLANLRGDDVDNNKMLIAFNAGVAGNIAISEMFAVQVEALYDAKGAKYEGTDASGNEENYPFSLGYITVPILAQASFGDEIKFYGELGPTIGLLMSAKLDGESEMTTMDGSGNTVTVKYKDNYKSTDFGLGIGAGAKVPLSGLALVIGARYNLGLTNIGEEQEVFVGLDQNFQPIYETKTPDVKNGVFSINVGIMLGGD